MHGPLSAMQLVYPKISFPYVYKMNRQIRSLSAVNDPQLPRHRIKFRHELSLHRVAIGVGSNGVEINVGGHGSKEVADLV